jgi:hypothetical protein
MWDLLGQGVLGSVGPGGVLVVDGAVSETAVEDADEAVPERSEGLMVGETLVALVVVEGAGTGAGAQRAERPLVDGIREAPVSDEPGQRNVAVA